MSGTTLVSVAVCLCLDVGVVIVCATAVQLARLNHQAEDRRNQRRLEELQVRYAMEQLEDGQSMSNAELGRQVSGMRRRAALLAEKRVLVEGRR